MPAKAKLFDSKCTAIFDFGAASRNMVQYNPQGTRTSKINKYFLSFTMFSK